MIFRAIQKISLINFNRKISNISIHKESVLKFFGRRIGFMSFVPVFFIAKTIKCDQNAMAINQIRIKEQADKKQGSKAIQKKKIPQKIWNAIIHIVRFFHLLLIFAPPILLSPLLMFESTKKFWMDCFVKSVERAGVVFIKAFQYLSHRRDIIGADLATKFEHLRQNAPTHSFEETKNTFKRTYAKNIEDIFDQFDPKPIASGSVSQVYQAKYKGKKVAVKVRHPGVDKYIERDINLMFFLSYLASYFSPSMEIPVSQDSLKRTLTEQINFKHQMNNLFTFREMFKYSKIVKFPLPISESTEDSVLVESFVEGVPVTYFKTNRHPLNQVIARIGSKTFFEMLMKNNFIHADCHGGNIYVQVIQQQCDFFTQVKHYLYEIYYSIENKLKSLSFENQTMKKLYLESRSEQKHIRDLIRRYKQKIVVTLIDVGMVIKLQQIDKQNFVNFLKSVIQGKGEKCAEMIYYLSNYEGKKIQTGKFQTYHQRLKDLFSELDGQDLNDLNGMKLMFGMLEIIRQNQMKLDGEFATLITNMMVLESIAKEIDPSINLLKCAFPFFKYVQNV